MVRAMSASTRTPPIRRVAVLGAGVMGSGIAAHCANAGIPVVLLDIVPPKLTEAEKRTNRKLAQIRVKVEHDLAGVKRSRIVKDVLRNTKDGVSDAVMEAACGLHNVRGENRKRPLKT